MEKLGQEYRRRASPVQCHIPIPFRDRGMNLLNTTFLTSARQDPGKVGTSPGEQNRGADSSATGGNCLSTSCGGREKDAPRYNGNGSEHSLSNRQQSVGGWDAGADQDHEADQRPGRRARDTIAGSAANDRIPGNGNCPAQPVQGSGAEKEDAGEIPGVGALDATGTEPGAAVLGGDPQRSEACGESETASGTAGEETGVGCDEALVKKVVFKRFMPRSRK